MPYNEYSFHGGLNNSDIAPPDSRAVRVLTPASGTVVSMGAIRQVFIANTATLVALTVQLPAGPVIDDITSIGFQNPVTALTIQTATGAAVANAPAAGAVGSVEFRFLNGAWQRWR